jgi:hypothetical protein
MAQQPLTPWALLGSPLPQPLDTGSTVSMDHLSEREPVAVLVKKGSSSAPLRLGLTDLGSRGLSLETNNYKRCPAWTEGNTCYLLDATPTLQTSGLCTAAPAVLYELLHIIQNVHRAPFMSPHCLQNKSIVTKLVCGVLCHLTSMIALIICYVVHYTS